MSLPEYVMIPCEHGYPTPHYVAGVRRGKSSRTCTGQRRQPLLLMAASKAFKQGLKMHGMSDEVMLATVKAALGLGGQDREPMAPRANIVEVTE